MNNRVLKISDDDGYEPVTCPRCGGIGKVTQPPTWSVRGQNHIGPYQQPGTGCLIPCPYCRGKKTIVMPKRQTIEKHP